MVRRLVVLLVVVAGCAAPKNNTDPVTGKAYASPLGNDFASHERYVTENHFTAIYLAQDGGELPEPEIAAYCDGLVQKIAAAMPAAHRRGFLFRLYLTAAPQVNAYTYGGGRMHCYVGLVAESKDAAELAGVLAHEIGHNSHDHIGQQLGRTARARNIMSLGGLLGNRTIVIGSGIVAARLMKYSRNEEKEADDRAVDYTIAAGIDPDGLARFFSRLENALGLRLFQSHPNPDKRVPRIRERIQRIGAPNSPMRTSPEYEQAAARAREIRPFYTALFEALAGDDLQNVHAACDKGIAALPRHPQFHYWKGIAFQADKQPKEALPHLRDAAERDTSNYMIPLSLCIVELEVGTPDRAAATATRAIEILPTLPQPYVVRGAVHHAAGRQAEGRKDFDRALALVSKKERKAMLEQMREVDPVYYNDRN